MISRYSGNTKRSQPCCDLIIHSPFCRSTGETLDQDTMKTNHTRMYVRNTQVLNNMDHKQIRTLQK